MTVEAIASESEPAGGLTFRRQVVGDNSPCVLTGLED